MESTVSVNPDAADRRGVGTVVFVVFLDLLGFGIVIPILPFYVRSFGVSDVYIGLLAASYSLLQFGFAPVLGRLSDARGRRPVLVLSLLGSAVAWTAFGVGGSLAVLFAARMLAGAMGGNIAAAQAYIADVTPPEDRAGALGLVGAAFGLGFVFGPAVGGLFASDAAVGLARSVLPAAVPATRFSLPSFAAAASSLLAAGFAVRFLRETGAPKPAPRLPLSWPRRVRRVVAPTEADADAVRLRPFVLAYFLVSLAFSGVQVMFIPYVADVYGYSATQAAGLLAYVGVFGILNQGVIVGRLAKRVPVSVVATAGAAVLLVALAGLPFTPQIGRAVVPANAVVAPELVALLVALPLLSFGNGLLSVGLTTLVSTATGADRQGSAFGVTQGAGSLGRTVGPPVMAALYAAAAYWTPFVVGAALLVPVVVALIRIASVPPSSPADPDRTN
ncbi:MFS transporter [Halostella sp. JP-L12]|nr:MFS transporter [Halostella sp. JP-L12]